MTLSNLSLPLAAESLTGTQSAEGLQGAHGRGTLFATWWARMDWKKFENCFVRDSRTVSERKTNRTTTVRRDGEQRGANL